MAEVPVASLKSLARELDALKVDYAFTGGSIVGLLLDNPELTPIRPTNDVDIIVEVLSRKSYSSFEDRLRARGFVNDIEQGAPLCRWKFNTLIVDVMPVGASFLGLNTMWFDHALENAKELEVDGETIRVVSPASFVATKLAAFNDRGRGDYLGSRDLEDIIAIVDGNDLLLQEIKEQGTSLLMYVAAEVARLLKEDRFVEALPAHLPPDAGSQARIPLLIDKLNAIADCL